MNTNIVKYQDNIYAIEQDMARAFCILGKEKAVLFDTGASPADLSLTIKDITSLPVQLVLSHADPDHIANANQFNIIYAHPFEADCDTASAFYRHKSCPADRCVAQMQT